MKRKEARRYWTARYEAARKWDDPHWGASERKEHRRYVDALNTAIKALSSSETPTESTNAPTNTPTDLISRSRAIKEVSEWATDILHPKNLIKEDAIGILESLPSAEPKTGWIPVTKDGKNFPPYSEFILVWVNYGFEVASYEYDPETGADFWHMDFYDLYGENIWEVKAWCPLPEPYREDGEA